MWTQSTLQHAHIASAISNGRDELEHREAESQKQGLRLRERVVERDNERESDEREVNDSRDPAVAAVHVAQLSRRPHEERCRTDDTERAERVEHCERREVPRREAVGKAQGSFPIAKAHARLRVMRSTDTDKHAPDDSEDEENGSVARAQDDTSQSLLVRERRARFLEVRV